MPIIHQQEPSQNLEQQNRSLDELYRRKNRNSKNQKLGLCPCAWNDNTRDSSSVRTVVGNRKQKSDCFSAWVFSTEWRAQLIARRRRPTQNLIAHGTRMKLGGNWSRAWKRKQKNQNHLRYIKAVAAQQERTKSITPLLPAEIRQLLKYKIDLTVSKPLDQREPSSYLPQLIKSRTHQVRSRAGTQGGEHEMNIDITYAQ
jgi:hypothetical protein